MLNFLLPIMLQASIPSFATADRVDIPTPYRGHWALDPKYCDDPGPANVSVGARTIDFYERHGFLDLAQLNDASEPPVLHGQFRWAELLHFSTSALRMEIDQGRLYITESEDPEADRSKGAWTRCAK